MAAIRNLEAVTTAAANKAPVADLGVADLGVADLGAADLGAADLGTADLGAAARVTTSMMISRFEGSGGARRFGHAGTAHGGQDKPMGPKTSP